MNMKYAEAKKISILHWLETLNNDIDLLKGINNPHVRAAHIVNLKFIIGCLVMDVDNLTDSFLI